MKPMWRMPHVPANPGWQRTILVILVERREVSPLRIAAQDLRHARFEIDPEAFPDQQENTRTRRSAVFAPTRAKTTRRKKHRNKSRFQQHPVGLVGGEILSGTDKREEADKTDRQHAARPEIQHEKHRSDHSRPANHHERARPARKP